MWTGVEILSKEDLGERGYRVHVRYSSDDKTTVPLESEVDIPLNVNVLQFFDAAVKAKLSDLNNPTLKTAFDALPIGVYALAVIDVQPA